MKKIVLLFVVLLGMNITVRAQDKKDAGIEISEKNISKKWVFKDLINPKFSKEEYEETKTLMEGISLELKTDKTSIMSFIIDLDGTWTLDLITNKISITDRKGTHTWKIHSLKENEIILSRDEAVQKIIFQAE